jgi:hypothetical protein
MPRTTRSQPHPTADTPGPPPAARDGREANGRFAKFNKGGPGNPYARQTAALRKALVEAVKPQDMEAIATSLILRARAGNLAAIKLLFSYVIGKPGEAVNPDTLALEEMQQYDREVGMEAAVCRVGRALTPEIACDMVRTVRPLNMSVLCNTLADHLLEGLPPEYRPDDGDAPSANGDNGVAGDREEAAAEEEAPLANGENGGEEPAAAGAPEAGGNGPKCRRETGRATPAAGPRQAPPWPGGRHEAPHPEDRGTNRRGAPREPRPAKPGGPPPRA